MAGCQNCISCGLYTLPNDALAVKLQQQTASNGVSGSTGGGLGCDASDPAASPVQSGLYVVVDGVTTFLANGAVTSKNKRFSLTRSGTFSTGIPNNATTAITPSSFGTIVENTGSLFLTGANMVTVPVAGVYSFGVRVSFAATWVSTQAFTRFIIAGAASAYNGAMDCAATGGQAAGYMTGFIAGIPLLAGTTIDLSLFQVNGALATQTTTGGVFWISKESE